MSRWHGRVGGNDRAARPGSPRRIPALLLPLAFLASLIASLSHRQLLPIIPIALSLLALRLAVPSQHADGLCGWGFVASARRAILPALLAALLVSGGSGWSSSPVSATGGTPFVWAWGTSPLPVENGALAGMVAVEVGFSHRLAVANDGTVWAWGSGWVLADGTSNTVTTPAQVHGPGGAGVLSGITAVAGGGSYTLARAQDGTVWAWGNNLVGQLGTNGGETEATVARVVGPGGAGYLGSVTAVAAGLEHSLALRSDGTVWAWGYNGDYELGNTLGNSATPVLVAGLGGVTAIAAGDRYNLALRSDGTVWAWGRNDKGQLGSGTATPAQRATPAAVPGVANIVAIAAGASHALALAQDGTVWAWGDNLRGAVGDGATTSGIRAATHVAGTNGTGLLGGVTAIAAGTFSSQALLADGTVRSWGSGSRLGNGTTCTGTGCDRPFPVPVNNLTGVTAIAAGQAGALAIADPVAVGLSATSLTFPAQPVGTTGAAQAVTLTNTSAISVPLGTVVVVGDFDASGNCGGTTLAPGASCTLNVTFTPTEVGARAGGLTIGSNVAGSPSVGLSGEGLPGSTPFAVLTPGQLSFPSMAVGSSSSAQTAMLRNDGGGDLHIAAIDMVGDFTRTTDCPTTLAAGAQCSIAVTFIPTAAGVRTGRLQVTSDAPGSPHAVVLSGIGIGAPILTASPPSLNFGSHVIASSSTLTVEVRNQGTADASFTSIQVLTGESGTTSQDFGYASVCRLAPFVLAAGQSCIITIYFTPQRGSEAVMVKDRVALLTLTGANDTPTLRVRLDGQAAPAPLLYVHGFKSDYRNVEFTPIFVPLRDEYPLTMYPVDTWQRNFRFFQDTGNNVNNTCQADTRPFTPASGIALPSPKVPISPGATICDSQSASVASIVLLYNDVRRFYEDVGRERKIVISCNSAGCMLVRGFLAYAEEMHALNQNNPSAYELVDSVVFLEPVQSGAIGAMAAVGGAFSIPYPFSQIYAYMTNGGLLADLSRPQVYDMLPNSDYLAWVRRPPSGQAVDRTPRLAYFNVYGDLRLVAQTCMFTLCYTLNDLPIGDFAVLPGTPSPYSATTTGGSRFLYGGTTGPANWEWGMRREFTYSPVAPPLPTVVSAPTGLVLAAGRAFQAPEQHRNFGGAAPNNLTAIDIDDCRTKVAIKVHGQVLKVLRGRLYDQHILYSCVP